MSRLLSIICRIENGIYFINMYLFSTQFLLYMKNKKIKEILTLLNEIHTQYKENIKNMLTLKNYGAILST